MSVRVQLDIQCASKSPHIPEPDVLNAWAVAAVTGHLDFAEISLRIVDAEEGCALNNEWRGKNSPTNVLSFPAALPSEFHIPLLGDLVICAPVVEQEAEEQGKSLEAHWAHMVVHGTLHLLNYDHIELSEAETMESLETEIITALGFPAPYDTCSPDSPQD